jgi:hypothetical protein
MFKTIREKLQKKQEYKKQEAFERGYGYAMTELLLHKKLVEDVIIGFIDYNEFDKGVEIAIHDYEQMKDRELRLNMQVKILKNACKLQLANLQNQLFKMNENEPDCIREELNALIKELEQKVSDEKHKE